MATDTLNVWIDQGRAGILGRENRKKYVFSYKDGVSTAVSLTMPIRLESWVFPDLHPIFQMNLPEGALLEAIRNSIAKIIGSEDLDILSATGGNQIGRNRFSLPKEGPPDGTRPPESLEELLTYPDTGELFHELIARYALRSGVSGVQPKVLLEAQDRGTLNGEGYIVKSWGSDFPQLAANEYFCMSAALRAGLPVPEFHLSENAGLFVMKRFDRDDNGNVLGFEDMCSLQGLGTRDKYAGSYERVAKTIKSFITGEQLIKARRQFFATLVLSSMVRNGDAHLKNFGVLYSPEIGAPVAIAPVYDIVTTTAYIRKDTPALTIEGRKVWWLPKTLEKFALSSLGMPVKEVQQITEQVADAVMETRQELASYIGDHPGFEEIGGRMMDIWMEGVQVFGLSRFHIGSKNRSHIS
jgi:serine/threonine-protein kinase HipA